MRTCSVGSEVVYPPLAVSCPLLVPSGSLLLPTLQFFRACLLTHLLLLAAAAIRPVRGAVTTVDFVLRTISSDVNDPYAVFAADIDSDGDLDVVAAMRGDSSILWWENNIGDEGVEAGTLFTSDGGVEISTSGSGRRGPR